MTKRNLPFTLKKIAVFGIISIAILASAATGFFLSVKANFQTELKDFERIVISANLMSEMAQMTKENEYLRIWDYGCFNKPLDPSKSEIVKSSMTTLIKSFRDKVLYIIFYKLYGIYIYVYKAIRRMEQLMLQNSKKVPFCMSGPISIYIYIN